MDYLNFFSPKNNDYFLTFKSTDPLGDAHDLYADVEEAVSDNFQKVPEEGAMFVYKNLNSEYLEVNFITLPMVIQKIGGFNGAMV